MEIEVSTEACSDSGRSDIEFRVVTGLDVDEASLVRELSLELKAQTAPKEMDLGLLWPRCLWRNFVRVTSIVAWSTFGTSLALGAGGGLLWWLASEDEKEFRAQDYPRDLNESLAIKDRGKLRALIGDVLVASAGVGVLSAATLWLFWEPGMSASDGPQIALVPRERVDVRLTRRVLIKSARVTWD